MSSRAVTRALTAASEYVRYIDVRRAMGKTMWLEAVHEALAELYASCLGLPSVDRESDSADWEVWTHDDWHRLYVDLKDVLGPVDLTKEVFDPYGGAGEEPVVGSVADALADIYGDATRALVLGRTSLADASNELLLMFETHTGHHAIDAIRALHAYRFEGSRAEEPDAELDKSSE